MTSCTSRCRSRRGTCLCRRSSPRRVSWGVAEHRSTRNRTPRRGVEQAVPFPTARPRCLLVTARTPDVEDSPMPTYQYRCVDCGSELETVQKFSDPSLTECPECDGTLRKVYSAVGVVFKGSGFYATDNRTKGKTAAATATTNSEKSPGTEKSSGSEKAATPSDSGSSSTKSTSSSTTSAA